MQHLLLEIDFLRELSYRFSYKGYCLGLKTLFVLNSWHIVLGYIRNAKIEVNLKSKSIR